MVTLSKITKKPVRVIKRQAFCKIRGKFIYLGRYGSKTSREKYERVIAEYLSNGKKLPPTKTQEEISIAELAVEFLNHAEGYYIDEHGKPTGTLAHCRLAIAPVVKHYGENPIADFTPLALMFIRDKSPVTQPMKSTVKLPQYFSKI